MFVESNTAFAIAGALSAIAIFISLLHITLHLLHYTVPSLQRTVCRLLLLVPIYALSSWLSLVYKPGELYFDVVRDCYEAYVIYLFLCLMLEYAGGEQACVSRFVGESLRHPKPCCCLTQLTLNGRFLRQCKKFVIQFVYVKPIMAVVSLTLLSFGKYENVVYQWILLTIYNVSYTVALMALFYFYLAIRRHIGHCNPVRKFLAVKSVVFMTYYQNLAVSILPGITTQEANRWNDFILCCEMTIFAVMHCFAFSPKEFFRQKTPNPSSVVAVHKALREVLSVQDVIEDTKRTFGEHQTPLDEMLCAELLTPLDRSDVVVEAEPAEDPSLEAEHSLLDHASLRPATKAGGAL
jgi:hypothetical protein